MLGAIAGDIIGSPYEFEDHPSKTKEFPLFGPDSHFTDDTVMTVAVAEGVMEGLGRPDLTAKAVTAALRRYGRLYPDAGYGRLYPDAGYGGRFSRWLKSADPKPYDSFGNGSAMRVSSVAWLYSSLRDVEAFAAITAEVTHNHPEGIKGAQATAGVIFLARSGYTLPEIRSYVEKRYGYDLHRTLAQIRPSYAYWLSCQQSVPEAILSFLESRDFEDAVRNAVSLGGDSDTLAAIAGSIAEGRYGIPAELQGRVLALLDPPLRKVLDAFEQYRQTT